MARSALVFIVLTALWVTGCGRVCVQVPTNTCPEKTDPPEERTPLPSIGLWSSIAAADEPSLRRNPDMFVSSDQLVVFGGRVSDDENGVLRDGGILSVTNKTWLPIPADTNFKDELLHAGNSTWLNGKLHHWLSREDAQVKAAYSAEYDATKKAWLPKATESIPVNSRIGGKPIWNGKEFLLLGTAPPFESGSGFYKYDPAADKWSFVVTENTPKSPACGMADAGSWVIITDKGEAKKLQTGATAWTDVALSAPTDYSDDPIQCVISNNQLFMSFQAAPNTTQIVQIDLTTLAQQTLDSTHIGSRQVGRMVATQDGVALIADDNHQKPVTVFVYVASAKTWYEAPELDAPRSRRDYSAVVLDKTLYLFGGNESETKAGAAGVAVLTL